MVVGSDLKKNALNMNTLTLFSVIGFSLQKAMTTHSQSPFVTSAT